MYLGVVLIIINVIWCVKMANQYYRSSNANLRSASIINASGAVMSGMCFFLAITKVCFIIDIYYSGYTFIDQYNIWNSKSMLAGLYTLLGIVFLIKTITPSVFNDKGIDTFYGFYTWENIRCFKWGARDCIKNRKGILIAYYTLIITTKKFRTKDIELKIKVSDRDRIDTILKRMITVNNPI